MVVLVQLAVFSAVMALAFAVLWHVFALRAARKDIALRLLRLHEAPQTALAGNDLIRDTADRPTRLAELLPFRVVLRLLRQSGATVLYVTQDYKEAIRAFNDFVAKDPRVEAVMLTVGDVVSIT